MMELSCSKFYLIIEPFIYFHIVARKILFYNTLDGTLTELLVKPEIESLFDNDDHRYVYEINSETILNDQYFVEFVNKIESNHIGYILNSPQTPVQIPPFFNVITERLKPYDKEKLNDLSLLHLTEISIYLNSNLVGIDSTHGTHKQVLSCYNSVESIHELDYEEIINFIYPALKESALQKVNLLGGDITEYSKINHLLDLILSYEKRVNVFIELTSNLEKLEEIISSIKNVEKLNTICTIRKENLSLSIINKLKKICGKIDLRFQCMVDSLENYKMFENTLNKIDPQLITYKPFYTGKNLNFFEENVFINKDDIFSSIHKQTDIYIKQKLNKIEFGRLIILNDGKVHTNLNCRPIGQIGIDTIQEIVYELINNKSSTWFSTRKNDKVCSNCIYHAFCPSISNYELVLKKTNLCFINFA